MRPDVYWIETMSRGRLAIMPRPRAGDWLEDEIAGWQSEGIKIVVSLLESHEVSELGLQGEAELCRNREMEFISFPIPDRGVPGSRQAADTLAEYLADRVAAESAVAIHCRAGIGRSSLMAARVLSLLDVEVDKAFDLIGKARGLEVPDTEGQREWIYAYRSEA